MPIALITGITGQDGSYLAEHLLGLDYEVHGTIRTTTHDIEDTRVGHLLATDPPGSPSMSLISATRIR